MSLFFDHLAPFIVLSYALVGGVFLAFSDFIMRSLSLSSGAGGAEAMQIINREVFRWIFMTLFLGMAGVSLFMVGYAATSLEHPARSLILSAGLVYLLGCFAVTIVCNVPMNEALAKMDLAQDAAMDYWKRTYLPRWTFWNSFRTVACVLSAALLLFGLLWLAQTNAQAV